MALAAAVRNETRSKARPKMQRRWSPVTRRLQAAPAHYQENDNAIFLLLLARYFVTKMLISAFPPNTGKVKRGSKKQGLAPCREPGKLR